MTDSLLVTLSVGAVVTLPGRPDITIRLVRVIDDEAKLGITASRPRAACQWSGRN